jgi:hypothetical protein
MSRAFRDTFKQTFCICKAFDRRQSATSVAQGTKIDHRKGHLSSSVVYKCSDGGDLTSLTPIMESLSVDPNKIKKPTSLTLPFFHHTNSISL